MTAMAPDLPGGSPKAKTPPPRIPGSQQDGSEPHLSAGVEDRRLGPRGEDPAGSPDREALRLGQLDGLWQEQGLLPGAVPGQRQLGARQGHRQLLGKGHSQEDSMHVRGKPVLRFRLSFQRRKQGSSPEGQILNRPQQKSP